MEKECFLMLVALSQDTAAVGKALMERIKKEVDPNAAPLWIDSRGIGVMFTTDLPAWRIWKQAYPDTLSREHLMALKDVLIVQVGPQWEAEPTSRAGAWLNARFPKR